MKKLLFLLFLIPIAGFSQNKKALIATVNQLKDDSSELAMEVIKNRKRIESLKSIIKLIKEEKTSLRNSNNNLQLKIDELTESLELEKVNLNNQKLKNEKLVNDFNDTISLLIKENDSLKLDSKYIVDYDLKYVPKDTDCDSIFLIEFKINDKVVFSEEVCGSELFWFKQEGPVKTFQGLEYGEVVANTTYHFLNFYDTEITVCKDIETNLEVPYYYWIKNYRLDWKSNTWKLEQTIENQNEINNFINGLKLIK